jgi:hypothetical protein
VLHNIQSCHSLKAYAPYVNDLRRLVLNRRADPSFAQLAERAVNGEASSRLMELVSAYGLKRTGAFFSSSELSERTAASIPINGGGLPTFIADPACGAGNLLLAAAKRLPTRRSLSATLRLWGHHLAGFDLHSEFIRAVHLRLAVLALGRGAKFDLPVGLSIASFFPHIRRGDGLRELAALPTVTDLLINPPFGPVTAPKNCSWATGKVTKAAIFFERCLNALPANTRVSAILPDVLRAGSRYQRWREAIETRASVHDVVSVGNFETADVDVFLLHLTTQRGKSNQGRTGLWWAGAHATESVGNHFDVHVGAVVPHRLKKNEGPTYPYLHAKELPFWGSFRPGEEEVSFVGKAVRPPFVAVRRTSSPSDRFRALGTIICGDEPVAVENHLLVCLPKTGGLTACEGLLEVLQQPATNTFLNGRIRCRHLTVGVVQEIPWSR